MDNKLLIAGGGIGGLGAALACARAGVSVELLEQASEFSEVGAGIQLGPNAVRVLADWGLMDALREVAAFPEVVSVCDAHDGQTLGTLALGAQAVRRYGQPYATIHRADAHRLLLNAVQQQGDRVRLHLKERVRAVQVDAGQVLAHGESGQTFVAPALLGCDGLWSMVRKYVMGGVDGNLDAPPRFSGHLAYRGLVPIDAVPAVARGTWVNAWLGPRLHVVHYPVSGGRQLNVVAVVHGRQTGNPQSWTHEANRADLMQAMGPVHRTLTGVLEAVGNWKLWPLNDRPPMTGSYCQAMGRVALAGDAAHPLRPYLAQGAAMALEDGWTLGRQLQALSPGQQPDWPALFQHFAKVRWRRNAKVQSRSARNGTAFHAEGALRVARNLGLAVLGERLLDNPWLYSGPPQP